MRTELSILIPTFNGDCREQVSRLSEQAQEISGLNYEIVVADDGSTNADIIRQNETIEALPHCHYLKRAENVGRSRIRNFLVSKAHYEWVLIMDCEMSIVRADFLRCYLESETEADVIYGGIVIGEGPKDSLRYLYEKRAEPLHSVEMRRQKPYKDFHTANFMARRMVLTEYPFDERFSRYGYEDVLLGKCLRQHGITIHHIDNPVGFNQYEPNESFVRKTEDGLQTLYEFRADLRGYSQMLTFADGIHLSIVKGAIRLWHRLFGKMERRNLCGRRPSLYVFKLYKIGYYLRIEKVKT